MQIVPDSVPVYYHTRGRVTAVVGGHDLSKAVTKAIEDLGYQAQQIGCTAVYSLRLSHAVAVTTGGNLYYTVVAYGSAVSHST